ncbi:hypothetical protein [Hydrogenophaga laconesensis]|uniref:Uncharacterized protein n=1 Tax=Hydrogenophaga laconesensis TaxID=1805971 RepID=A0ABU1V9J7_9BURK|nr:hypothetical protein [Hydrogenophaga laconesensis]MDR7094131.1 hypothetical protein [Hydrogenophaga laconesensis]
MKVIAKISEGRYMCEVSHEELEKCLDKYYGNMGKLSVGDSLNLGQGYDFAVRIESACKKMAEAVEGFDHARSTMTAYALAVADRSSGKGGEE